MKSKLLLFLILLPLTVICQDIMVTITPATLTARKYENEKLIIPIEIAMELTAGSVPAVGTILRIPFAVTISPSGVLASLTLAPPDFGQIVLQGTVPNVTFTSVKPKETIRIYLIVPAGVNIVSNKAIMLQVTLNGEQAATKQFSFEPANDIIYSRNQYFKTTNVELDYVSKVESAENILTVSGYINQGFTKRKVLLEQNEVLAITETYYILGPGYFNSAPFSFVAVPFKIRPKVQVTLHKTSKSVDTTFTATAMSGITNLGINIDLFKWNTDRYFASGKKATHKWGFGLIITPGVEELSALVIKDTSLVSDKKSKQLYISVGLSAFYSYNGITFFIVPAAIDWAPSRLGKQWIYNKKFWWGFGIGVSPTIFAQIFNK